MAARATRRASSTWAPALACLIFGLVAAAFFAGPGAATPGDIGYRGPSFSGAGTAPSGSKPESKLWRNDGFWWASMWDTASQDFHIFTLVIDKDSTGKLWATWTQSNQVYVNRTTAGDASWGTPSTGLGTPFIRDAANLNLNNVTSTKQNLNSTTGLVVLAPERLDRLLLAQLRFSDATASPDRRLQRGSDLRDGSARRQLHRQLDRSSHRLVLELRGRRYLDTAAPQPHLRRRRHVHRQPHRLERKRRRHRDARRLHHRDYAATRLLSQRLPLEPDRGARGRNELHARDYATERLCRVRRFERNGSSRRSKRFLQPQPSRRSDLDVIDPVRHDQPDDEARNVHADNGGNQRLAATNYHRRTAHQAEIASIRT